MQSATLVVVQVRYACTLKAARIRKHVYALVGQLLSGVNIGDLVISC